MADPNRVDVPDSVIGFLRGELGTPAGGWTEPLRSTVLRARGVDPLSGTPPLEEVDDDEATLAGAGTDRRHTLNRLLFPGPAAEFDEHRRRYGDTSHLSANQFF